MEEFVADIYQKHEKDIDAGIKEIAEMIGDINPKIWRKIENILNEKFDNNYLLKPTMLPFSPYGKGYFNFSIASRVLSKLPIYRARVVTTASHELSHLLYYKKINRIFQTNTFEEAAVKAGVSAKSFDGLKEIYALIIQNHPSMKKFFPNKTIGNREYTIIKVLYKKHVMSIEDYFIEQYATLEKRYSDKDKIDFKMIELLKHIDDEFKEKLIIFNTTSENMFVAKGLYNPISI